LQALVIATPPTEEQKAIVSEMETRLSLVNGMEVAVENNLLRAERLRQSILSKAFSGAL
jgi:type I restriction enzyme S subunit